MAYTYDAQGRMASMTTWSDFAKRDGARTTTWQYDGRRGWLTRKLYPDQQGPAYQYWPSGRLKARVWARGLTTSYQYDAAGQLEGVSYSDKATAPVAYTYDRLGRRRTVTQNGAVTTCEYTAAGQLRKEAHRGGLLDGVVFENTYSDLLRRIAYQATNTSGQVLATANYGYDAATRLSVVSSGDISAQYEYLENSGLVGRIDYQYGGASRMKTIKTYHDIGNRKRAKVNGQHVSGE